MTIKSIKKVNKEFTNAVTQEKWIMEKGRLRREGASISKFEDVTNNSTNYFDILQGNPTPTPTPTPTPMPTGSLIYTFTKTFYEFLHDGCMIFYHSYKLPNTTNIYIATMISFCMIIGLRLKLNQVDHTTDYGPLDWPSN